jgi:HD-GYP domain-containing protein (c-di-GMP phosphodiesterase class II)
VQLALDVALELGLDEQTCRRVDFGAMLHDVGKVAIPKEIINKPGPLDPEEWEIVKTHTTEGQRMLDQVGGLMRSIGLIVRAHHERWDGTGYPDGLRRDEIPIEARIVSACDTWNAMTTTRSYRIAMSREAAMAELTSAAGTQLDPGVIEALIRVIVRTGEHRLPV